MYYLLIKIDSRFLQALEIKKIYYKFMEKTNVVDSHLLEYVDDRQTDLTTPQNTRIHPH